MSMTTCLRELGGVATRAELVRRTSRAAVDRALACGDIVADARGRYALPVTDAAVRRAHALAGVLSLTSAALWRGWEVKTVPAEPHIIVPRKRKIPAERRAGVQLHRFDLHPDDIDGIATGVELTLTQCLRSLPFDEALAVADSALRHGVPAATLRRVAMSVRGPGSPQVRRVARAARGEAANPFESALRSIAIDVPGLRVEPQLLIASDTAWVRPDLVDRELGIILEADSFAWHGGRAQLRTDARRYNLLVVDGWIVLRFSWEDVMFDQAYVRSVLVAAVALARRRTEVPRGRCRTA
jgi:very-short-patch-repair endonuclease